MYAILDIETTGGKYNEEGITEIAIYRFDGHKVVDQFISLINPEIPIQPFVVGLTGINNEMLRNAPKFFEVAKRIVEITSDCILVAHNANFDYRILSTEFGLVLLDLFILLQKGIQFIPCSLVSDGGDFLLNLTGLPIVVGEMLKHPFPDVLAFADIDDLAFGIVQIIDSGDAGQFLQKLNQLGVHCDLRLGLH